MNDGQGRVRLRAREGEAVEWTRRVAQRAGTLKDMMDDAPTEDGVYPVPIIAAAELAVLREMCEADSMPARLEQCSISELFRLIEGASFLDAPGALKHAQRALTTRLNGKRADELRELFGATDDFGSAEDRVAALAEPAFSPEGQLSVATVGSAAGPPALQPQPSLSGMAVTDDAKEVALGMVDVGTLAELKGVSQSWLALARRVLCSRLSRCEGQPAPTQLADITDLDIKVLVDAGRPWEAAAAGRMLPSLARLRWKGFTVSVAAVREVDLETPSQEREFLGGRAKAALLSCIEGNGEPPLELLLAAVGCAGSGEVLGIPVQMMRDDSVSELDLRKRNIGVQGGMLLAHLVPIMGGLTALDLSCNGLRDEGVSAVCEAVQSNNETKLASLNFKNNHIGPGGANAVAAMVAVTGALTKLSLAQNKLEEAATKAICKALEQNTTLKELDISGDWRGSNTGGSAGATHVAKMVRVNGGLTSLDLSFNELEDEGVSAVCKAIQSNKETKLASLNFKYNDFGLGGANAVAALVAVTGGLTSIDLSRNQLCGIWTDWEGDQHGTYTAEGITAIADALRANRSLTMANLLGKKLDAESANMLAEVAKQKGISLCGIRRDQTTANFFGDGLLLPDAILLASDLSQAVVTGGLTSINLSGNHLTNYGTDMTGIKELAAALGVNGALTKLSLAWTKLEEEGTEAICEALKQNKTLKELDLSGHTIGGEAGAKHVADMLGVNGALTKIEYVCRPKTKLDL